nr:PREDICTED: G protein pathway suppressor 2 isoform X1 [Latimeria chalumnae]|eukprot:XP_014345096.1 PREDICTED: G protein pathway suppressor 2 isoform X1 [Latimeria chalumnae]
MPALLERPKLSNAMARALHRHIMMERERKRQVFPGAEEEEVDKMMEQKMKEEQERRRKKEMEERMSLEETKEQIHKLDGKLSALQEEKHQLFLQLKKVLHEEEKRRRKEQSDMTTLNAGYQPGMTVHSSQHLINMQGSPVGHSRPGPLLGERSKQMFAAPVITGRPYPGQPGFTPGTPEHSQYQSSQSGHGAYHVGQSQHAFGGGQPVSMSYTGSQQLRGTPTFPTMQYLSSQQSGYAVHGPFAGQQGFIPLQKQLEHANQQSGFTDSSTLRPMQHPQALHPNPGLLAASQIPVQIQAGKSGLQYTQPASPGNFPHGTPSQQAHQSGFQASSQPATRHPYLQHGQGGRLYHK